MAQESLLNTNWNSDDEIVASELNTHGQAHLDLDGHGDALHSVQYVKALTGGDGIDPSSIGDGDTVSVAWGDANDLDSDGNVTSSSGISSLTGGIGILPATIGDGDTLDVDLSAIAGNNLTVDTTNNELDASGASGIASLSGGDGISPNSIGDGDTLAVAWADASALGTAGGLSTDSLTVAGNSVALGGSTGIAHADLSTLNSDDHHSKTSSASELSDVSPDSTSGAHHTKTDSASELTDVSADSASSAHHQEPTAGTGITDEGTNQFGINLSAIAGDNLTVDATNNELDASGGGGGGGSSGDPFVYDPGFTEFATGLTDEPINFIFLQSGESLVVERIEFQGKLGPSGVPSSPFPSIRVRDIDTSSTIGSAELYTVTKDPGSSASGNRIDIQLTNNKDNKIVVAPRVIGYIEGA